MLFFTDGNDDLHNAKLDILSQLSFFSINVSAKNFFNVDRRFIGAVCITITLP